MLSNAKTIALFIMAVLFLFVNGSANPQPAPQISESKPVDILVLPPRIIKYPSFSRSIDTFSLHIKSTILIEKVKVRIYFSNSENQSADFFTNNIQWKKEDKYYYLTNIYGKQSEIPIVENFFRLEVNYKFKPDKYTSAIIELLADDKVIKTIPVDFLSPFEISYLWNKLVSEVQNNPRQKIAAILSALILLWFLIDFIFRRKKRKSIPVCSTRARFSTLIEENQIVRIEETNNPFGCRLGGLKNKIKIEYKRSQIFISISGRKSAFPDNSPVDVDVNEFWKLHIEAQNYFGNDQQSHKNLIILLLPV